MSFAPNQGDIPSVCPYNILHCNVCVCKQLIEIVQKYEFKIVYVFVFYKACLKDLHVLKKTYALVNHISYLLKFQILLILDPYFQTPIMLTQINGSSSVVAVDKKSYATNVIFSFLVFKILTRKWLTSPSSFRRPIDNLVPFCPMIENCIR